MLTYNLETSLQGYEGPLENCAFSLSQLITQNVVLIVAIHNIHCALICFIFTC